MDFVGQDPNSEDLKCPAVFVDPDTGRLFFQGKTVTDPVQLAEFAKHSPPGTDESVVWLPADMAEIIAKAAAGTYEKGLVGTGPVTLEDLVKGAKHSAIHLETRDSYSPKHPAYLDWLAGGSGRHDRSYWEGLVRELTGRGVIMRRARVVSEPLSDHIRWEHMITDVNIAAGEDVRWLPRTRAFDLFLPGADFWLVDNRVVAFNFCGGDGTDTGEEIFTSDHDTVARCLLAFEQVWERATPHAKYKPS